MISKQLSEALARSYRPLDAAAYLRVHGWKQSHVKPDRYSLWTKSDAIRGDFEVLVPEMLDASDLCNRVAELMTTLAVEEGRVLDEVVEDIATPNCDVVRARLRDENEGATLSLENGAEAFRNIYDLLLAAGCSAWKPRAAYGPRKPDEALRFMRGLRLSPSRPGSYVIKVVSPVAPRLGQIDLFDATEEPFARRATLALARALQSAIDGVRNAAANGKVDALASAVPSGMSANLCDALAGLDRASCGVEFAFSWAAARPLTQNPGEHFVLPKDAAPYLEEISRWFRQTSVLEDAEFFGIVRELKKAGDETDRVTLTGTVNGERRTVLALLDGEVRLLAIQAFQERRPVTCVGELVKEGRLHQLRNPRSFAILADEE
jgi:hypothetical protein